jgi:hypothetical protein
MIAFNNTRALLTGLSESGSAVYRQIENAVLKDAQSVGGRRTVKVRRESSGPRAIGFGRNGVPVEVTKAMLRVIMVEVPVILLSLCGGLGLPKCSWERQMKEYILTLT